MKRYIRNKKGISIAECVIALTVITVISFAALSILLSSVSAKKAAVSRAEAQSFAESAFECFKASDNEAEFTANMQFAENVTLTGSESEGFTRYTYQCEEDQYTAILDVKYSENERSELNIKVLDKNEKEIIAFSYEKGD